MKKILELLLNIKKEKPSLLARSIETFTNESHIEQLFRQGRIYEYVYKARYVK